MGLAHGGLRQKNFVFYEEAIRVPLVYSNPELYPGPRQSTALVSHVDFLPTLAKRIAELMGQGAMTLAAWRSVRRLSGCGSLGALWGSVAGVN
jgi:hypothetical protein